MATATVRSAASEHHIRKLAVGTASTVCCLAVATVMAQQLTIPEIVARDGKGFYVPRLRELGPIDLAEVIRKSSIIVEGSVKPVLSYLSEDQRWIYTDYAVNVSEVLLDRRLLSKTPGPPRGILVKVFGGRITFQGVRVEAVDENLPAWKSGEQVILFVTGSTDPGKYQLVFEAAAFGVDANGINPQVKPREVFAEFRGVPKTAFLERVRREVAR